jgi:hypothetical protein
VAAPDVNQSYVVQAKQDDVLTRLLTVAGTDGYQLIGQTYGGFGLRRRRIPVWAIVLAVVFFPFGLLFLLVKAEEVVTVALERVVGGTQVSVRGRATSGLQRAIQAVLGAWQVAGAPAPRWTAPAPGMPPPPPPPSPGSVVPPPPPAAGTPATGYPPVAPVPTAASDAPPTAATTEDPVVEVDTPAPTWSPPAPPTSPIGGLPGGGPPGGALPMPLGPIGGPPGGVSPPPAAPPGGLGPLDLPDAPKLDVDPPPDRGGP